MSANECAWTKMCGFRDDGDLANFRNCGSLLRTTDVEAMLLAAFRDYHDDRKYGKQDALIYEQAVRAPIYEQAVPASIYEQAVAPQSNPLAPDVSARAHRPTTLHPSARKSALSQWIEADLMFR